MNERRAFLVVFAFPRIVCRAVALVMLCAHSTPLCAQTPPVIGDSFTGGNGTVLTNHAPDINAGSGWMLVGTSPAAVLSGGKLVPGLQDSYSFLNLASIDAGLSDAIVGVDFMPSGAGNSVGYPIGGLLFRSSDSSNFYQAGWFGGGAANFTVYKVVAGSPTLLASASIPITINTAHRLEAVLSGSHIDLWVDGVRMVQVADAFNVSATRHGLRWYSVYDWASSYDNFSIQQLPGVPTHVTLSVGAASVALGGTQTFLAQAFDAANNLVRDALFDWTSSNAGAGTLSYSGAFHGSAALRGVSASTTITASLASGPSANVSVVPDSSRTVLFDAFTGANGTAVAAHTPDIATAAGTWSVTSGVSVRLQGQELGVAGQDTSGGSARARVTIDSATADGVITADWQPASSGTASGYPIGGVMFRVQDTNNYWVAGHGFGGGYPLALWKIVNGNWSLINSVNPGNPVGARHLIEVRLIGPTIEVWWDSVQRLQYTDAFGMTSTVHGLCWSTYYDWLSTFDNFSVQAPQTVTIDHVTIAPAAPLVTTGDAQFLVAQAYDAANHVLPNAIFHWTVSDPTAATLSTAGYYAPNALVRGISANVTVTATPVAGPPGSVPITVDPNAGVYVLDRFSGVDNTVLAAHTPDVRVGGAMWTTFGSPMPVLRGQQLVPSGQDTSTFLSGASIDAGTADAVVGVDWISSNANGAPIGALIVRVQDSSNYLMAGYNVCGYPLALCRVEAGNINVLGSASPTLTGSVHRLEVKLAGSAISVSSDGVVLITATDGHFGTVTRHGVRWWTPYDWTSAFDNFSVKPLPAPAVSTVVVSPVSATVSNGGTQTFTAQAYDAANHLIPNTLFHWTVAGPTSRVVSTAYYASSASIFGVTGAATVTATPVSGASGSTTIATDASRQILYDSFSGADGTTLISHVPDVALAGGRWAVTSGYTQANLRGQTLGQGLQDTTCGCPLVAMIDAGASDGAIGVDWNAAGSGTASGYPIGGVVFRAQDALNYWVAGPGYASWGLSLWKVTNGNWARVTGSTVPIVPGVPHRIDVHLLGSVIEVWYDGAQEIVANDAYLASATHHGVATSPVYDWLSTFDNFSVEATLTAPITHVTVTPASATVTTGASTWFTAQAYDAANHPVPALFRWSVSDPTAGTVSTSAYYASSAVVRGVTGPLTVTAIPLVGTSGTATIAVDSAHTLLFDNFSGADDTALTAHAPNVHAVSGAWTLGSATSAVLRSNRVVPQHQTAVTESIRATIETGATDGTLAADFHAAPVSGTAAGYPVGGIVFRQRDASNFWVAGPGYGSWPLALWKVQNGNWYLEGYMSTPTLADTTGRLEVRLAGPAIEVWWDGARQLQYSDMFGIDQTKHGLLWLSYWDWMTAFDNLALEGTPRCVDSLAPAIVNVSHEGTSGTLTVSAASGCAWSVAKDEAWVTLSGATTGTGSGSLSYTIAANLQPTVRTATIAVGGRTVTVAQGAAPSTCMFSLWPGNGQWASSGGSGGFDVAASACSWTASTGSAWIHVTTPTGIDSATVLYTVDPNPSTSTRSGTIAIGGSPNTVLYTVEQDAGNGGSNSQPCTYAVTPFYVLFGSGGGQENIQITSSAGCSSEITSSQSWLTLSTTQGTGTWTTTITAAPNSDFAARVIALQVPGAAVVVEQNGLGNNDNLSALFLEAGLDSSRATFVWRTSSAGVVEGQASVLNADRTVRGPVLTPPTAPNPPGGQGCNDSMNIDGLYTPYATGCVPYDPTNGGDSGGESGPDQQNPPEYCWAVDVNQINTVHPRTTASGVYFPYSIASAATSQVASAVDGGAKKWNDQTRVSLIGFEKGPSGLRIEVNSPPDPNNPDEKCSYYSTDMVIHLMPGFNDAAASNLELAKAAIAHEMGHFLDLNQDDGNPASIMYGTHAPGATTCLQQLQSMTALSVSPSDGVRARVCSVMSRNR